jgi:hypothetical protein
MFYVVSVVLVSAARVLSQASTASIVVEHIVGFLITVNVTLSLPLPATLAAPRRVSFIGCCMASALTGKGPITLLFEHIGDPLHNTIMQTLQ